MRNLKALIVLLVFPFCGFAQEGTTSATVDVKSALDDRREISLSPGGNYTDETGWLYGLRASMAFPMTKRTQLELGGLLFRRADEVADRDVSGVFGGPIYNFGQEYKRAFFAGAGVGYSNIYPFERETNPDERLLWGYAQVGKRFALSNDGRFSYKPRIMYVTRGDDGNKLQIDAINFSYLF